MRATPTPMPSASPKTPARMWLLCLLLFAATTLNYLDRQTISILAPVIQTELKLAGRSESIFPAAPSHSWRTGWTPSRARLAMPVISTAVLYGPWSRPGPNRCCTSESQLQSKLRATADGRPIRTRASAANSAASAAQREYSREEGNATALDALPDSVQMTPTLDHPH